MANTVWVKASGAVVANTFVKLSSGQIATQDTVTGTDTLGVALNAASAAGDMVCVQVDGLALVEGHTADVAAGAEITSHTDGRMDAANTNDAILGIYLPEAVDGGALASSGTTAGILHRVLLYTDKTEIAA